MNWGIIELELNALSKGVESANRHNDSFPSCNLMTNNSYNVISVAGLCDEVGQC